jgi:hypothetical protein
MKKLLLLLLFIPFISLGQFSNNKNSPTTPNESTSVDSENQSSKEITFRKMSWGDSMEDLKKTYPEVGFERGSQEGLDMLIQEGLLIGINVYIVYIFSENELVAGMYNIHPKYKNSTDRLRDFGKISERLNEKYTMRKEDEWIDTTYKDRPNSLDHAISMGDVVLVERAEAGDTRIAHTLADGEHTLVYGSSKWVEILDQQQQDDF